MENIKYIPVVQATKFSYRKNKLGECIKKNKILLIISIISLSLFCLYTTLIINFINLLCIIK